MNPNEIYRHFNIKLNVPPVYIGCHKLAGRISTSVGIPYLNRVLGKKRTAELLTDVLASKQDKVVRKLRSGGKLTFYAK